MIQISGAESSALCFIARWATRAEGRPQARRQARRLTGPAAAIAAAILERPDIARSHKTVDISIRAAADAFVRWAKPVKAA